MLARLAISLSVVLAIIGLAPTIAESRSQLSADEVQSLFIGKPWHGPKGAFLFDQNGVYAYKDFSSLKPSGKWKYEVLPDGTLASSHTNYTFYRRGNRYEYYHSKSSKYYPAKPGQAAFLPPDYTKVGTQLTQDEVNDLFIGRPWHSSEGAFLFDPNGVYAYKDFSSPKPLGKWKYELRPDGTLASSYTNYTFYRRDNKYEYYHSKNSEFNPAKPGQAAFLPPNFTKVGRQLTADEVNDLFIGKPWKGPGGEFIFRKDGSYSYRKSGASDVLGTWQYEMKQDGTLATSRTEFTFFRNSEAFHYFHSRSNGFYAATPNRGSLR